MPNQLKLGTRRLSYVEDRIVAKTLDVLAAATSTNVSALIREATSQYLARVDKDKSIRSIAANIEKELSEHAEVRAQTELTPETVTQLTNVMNRIKR